MVEAAVPVEAETVAAGRGERLVGQRQLHRDATRVEGIANAGAPRLMVGARANDADFAEIDQGMVQPLVLQQLDDAVGHVAGGDAVEGDRHARACQPDGTGLNLERAVVDHLGGAPNDI